MFGSRHFDRVHEFFADQFEPEGADFVYRKNMKGAPIRVSAPERDAFVAAFKRAYRIAFWAVTAGTIFVILLLALWTPDPESVEGQVGMYGTVGMAVALLLATHYWLWAAPARALERRPALGQPRSRDEVRRLALARLSYGQLAVPVLFALVMLWSESMKAGVFHGWGLFWLVFAVAITVAAAFQAFRKWRGER